jgi:hypothetical protein
MQNQPPEGELKLYGRSSAPVKNIMNLWTYNPVFDDKMIKLLRLGEDYGD